MGQVLAKTFHYRLAYPNKAKTSWKILSHPWSVRFALVFIALFYVGVPVWFFFCPWLRRTAVFLHFADWPFQDLSSPESYGLSNTRHFFVETSSNVLLGTWHVLPQSLQNQTINTSRPFDDDRLVVLYLHGSAESRSAAYRRSMYRVLTSKSIDAHVLTFDYRGFGDSSYVSPTVRTLDEDVWAMYRWLNEQVPASRIVVWGHSMGTGLVSRMGVTFAKQKEDPFALVLEAPFTSVADATHTFPLSFFHRHLPFFQYICSDKTRHPDTDLNSEEIISHLTAPLLVLHAADDSMVWSEQGKRLWIGALRARSSDLPVPMFVELDGKYGCGHRNIHKAPNLPNEVHKFFEVTRRFYRNARQRNRNIP